MALVDDIERIVRVLTRQHQGEGLANSLAAQLRVSGHLERSEIGKACGVGPETISQWEQGRSHPTTQQSLAWLSVLYDRADALRAARAADAATRPRAAVEGGQNVTSAATNGSPAGAKRAGVRVLG